MVPAPLQESGSQTPGRSRSPEGSKPARVDWSPAGAARFPPGGKEGHPWCSPLFSQPRCRRPGRVSLPRIPSPRPTRLPSSRSLGSRLPPASAADPAPKSLPFAICNPHSCKAWVSVPGLQAAPSNQHTRGWEPGPPRFLPARASFASQPYPPPSHAARYPSE